MNLNALLEIVISLAALFWLLSTGCSFVIEALNSLVRNVRAEALERFICQMVLGDNTVKMGFAKLKGKLAKSAGADPLGLLSHGLMESLRKPVWRAGGDPTPPSYVPAELFANILLDRLTSLAAAANASGVCESLRSTLTTHANLQAHFGTWAQTPWTPGELIANSSKILEGVQQHTVGASLQWIGNLNRLLSAAQQNNSLTNGPALSRLLHVVERIEKVLRANSDAGNAAKTLKEVFGSAESAWLHIFRQLGSDGAETNVVEAVRTVVAHAPLPQSLREALRPIVANANFDLEKLRKGIEAWYDSVMERATGWFKRHTTWLLGGLGLVVAIGCNINPFLIAYDLSSDSALRRAGVAFAEQVVERQPDAVVAQKILFSHRAKELKWAARVAEAASAASAAGPTGMNELAREIQPLLLRSGQFAGLLPEVRGPVYGKDITKEWEVADRMRFLTALCAAWYEAQISAGRIPKSERLPIDVHGCPRMAAHFGVPPKSSAGAASDPLPAIDRNEDRRLFWSNPDVVWDTGLGTALWNVQVERAAGSVAAPTEPRKTLVIAFADAKRLADGLRDKLDDFLDRIPSLGWKCDAGDWIGQAMSSVSTSLVKDESLSIQCETKRSSDERTAYYIKTLGWGFVGWPLTALMVSFGAAFWFDLLSMLMNRRVTGPKPATATPTAQD